MVRTIALIGLAAALAIPQAAFAASNAPTGYGTEGPGGETLTGTQATSTFQRHWNAEREGENRALSSAEWIREHHKGFPFPF